MSFRQFFSFAFATLFTVTGAGWFNMARGGSLTFEIVADTSFADSGLYAGPGIIQVILSPSTAPGPATVSMQVYGVSTDGTLGSVIPLSPPSLSGNVAGDLTSTVTANNTEYSELDQNFTIASGTFPAHSFFDVFVTLSGSEVGTGATGTNSGTAFYLNIYDQYYNSIGVELLVNPNGNVDGTVLPVLTGPVTVTQLTSTIPEPSSVVLLGLALGSIALMGRCRNRRAG